MKGTILTEADLRRLVDLDAAGLEAVEEGFRKLAAGAVEMPPIMRVDVPEARGEVDVKSAYVRGWDSFAVKTSSGFFDNPARGLPTGSGLMVLLSAETGVPRAVLLDNGYLTHVRTGLAGAAAARALAPDDVETVAVLGAGDQARYQVRALALVRRPRRLLVHARDRSRAARCAEELGEALGLEAAAAASAEEAVRAAQLVVTCTPAEEPILRAEWLHPGLHITAMGSDAETKNEIEPGALMRADLYVADRAGQVAALGELRSAREAGLWTGGIPVELGQIITGAVPGRRGAQDITIADLTGTGAQDTAIASHVAALLAGRAAGTVIRS